MATIDSKNLLVWVKAMSRGQALPLDASEVHESLAAAQAYAATATAYAGQSVKAMGEDGKYHEYILQPTEAGYVLEEVGAIKEEDLKQYVQVVPSLPPDGESVEGVLYIRDTDGYIWTGSAWKKVFWDLTTDLNGVSTRVKTLEDNMPNYAPLANPNFTGTVTIAGNEAATKSYVDGLISNMVSDVPGVLTLSDVNPDEDEILYFKAGSTYRIAEAGEYFGNECETGDLVIALKDFVLIASGVPAEDIYYQGNDDRVYRKYVTGDVMVVQANIDGAVTSSADATTVGEIVVFDAVTGKIIKGSGVQIASLNDAIAKAHEHANKAKLDTYDKTQAELLAAAKAEAQGLVSAHETSVNTALNGKADKATTLAGYGITDAYTKTEVDNLLSPITQNLNTKASTTDVQGWIATAKEETLEEAATAAATALDARVGSIPADTTIQSYIDTAVGSGGTASAQAIATAKQEAITESKNYTNSMLTVVEF